MSKAEERGKTYALHKASEKLHDYYGSAMLSVVQFDGYDIKNAYIDGYHQAEKDLELTWEDINRIEIIIKDVYRDYPHGIEVKQFGVEVLKRFNKERKNNL